MSPRAMRWLAYGRWQLLDALWQRLLLPLVLTVLFVGFGFYSIRGMSSSEGFWASPDGALFSANMFRQAMQMFIPLAVLLGVNGIVSQDRLKGFYRFFFSKPVPVPGYYLGAYCMSGVAVVAGAAVIAAAIGWYATPQPVLGAALACALTFGLLGSLAFLFSALTVHDGITFLLVWVVTLLMRQLEPMSASGHWMHTVVRLLPPTHRLDAVREAMYTGAPWRATDLWHVLAYGAACLVLAVIALRRLRLAR